MTAVFTKNQRDFDNIRFMPANNFIRIHKKEQILGRRFNSIITVNRFWENEKVKEAYDLIYERQPELFTIKK